jgi:DNA invertase Pin-like site-specific DNA recombinase
MPPKKKKADVSKVVAYVRVSTDKQAEQGLSLDAQQECLLKYADLHKIEIVAIEADSASASSLERPGLQRALNALETGEASGLLIVKLDRLTRSVRDLVALIDEYFRDDQALISVSEHIDTGSAAGRLTLKILTTVAEWEREAIGERTSAVMQHMKAEGMFTGGFPPFGFQIGNGVLLECEEEQAVIKEVRAARMFGETLRGIARRTINPRTGRTFHPTQIVRML